MVDIYVGESKRHWALHRNLLCHHSHYFDTELNNDHKKAKGGKIELLDEDPTAFDEHLAEWLDEWKPPTVGIWGPARLPLKFDASN